MTLFNEVDASPTEEHEFVSTWQFVTDSVTPVDQQDIIEWSYGPGTTSGQGMTDWTKVSGTPVIYDGHVYVRSCGEIVKIDVSTGSVVWKRNSISSTTMFYHFVTCGDNKVVDNKTGKVYDADGGLIYELSQPCDYMVYYESGASKYFIGAGSNKTIYKYNVSPDNNVTDGVKTPELSSSGRSYSVTYSYIPPLVIGNKMVYVNHSMASLDVVNLDNLQLLDSYSFPKNVVNTLSRSQPTYYEGKVYFTTYTRPLLGESTYVYGSIMAIPLSEDGKFDISNMVTTKTMSDSMTSSVVFCGGYGYVNAGETMKVIDPVTLRTLAECESVLSHGTPVITTAYNYSEGDYQVYLYLNPYESKISQGKQDLWVFSHTVSGGVHKLTYKVLGVAEAQYCSQTMVLGPNGELVWYNDCGKLFCIKTNAVVSKKYDVRFNVNKGDTDVSSKVYVRVVDSSNKDVNSNKLVTGSYTYYVEWADQGIVGKSGKFTVGNSDMVVNITIEDNDCTSPSWNDWLKIDNNGSITEYSGPGGTLTIPDDVQATSISSGVFSNNLKIISVSIPNSIKSLQSLNTMGAFSGCSNLSSISASGVTEMGTRTFKDCSRLKEISLNQSMTMIPKYAFENCCSLETMTLSSLNTVGEGAFKDCFNLKRLNVSSNGLRSIGNFAFENCYLLSEIKLSKESWSNGTFNYDGLSLGSSAFENCRSLTSLDIKIAQSMGENSFAGCSSLVEVSVTGSSSLPGGAFKGCTSLVTLNAPDVFMIAKDSLSDCISLKNLKLSINAWRSFYFKNCESLESITIPEGTTTIGEAAFIGCSSLKIITIPDTVSTIGNSAFAYSGLTEFTIGPNMDVFNANAFIGCGYLKSFKTENSNYYVEDGVLFRDVLNNSVAEKTLMAYPSGKVGSKYVLSESIKNIGSCAFAYNTNLREVVIPGDTNIEAGAFQYSSVKSISYYGKVIGNKSLADCVDLVTVYMPNVVSIDNQAFMNSINLDYVLMPSSLKSLGHSVFVGCQNTTTFIFDKNVEDFPKLPADNPFYPFRGLNVKFYLPEAKGSDYWTSKINSLPKSGNGSITPVPYSEYPSQLLETISIHNGDSVKKSSLIRGSIISQNLEFSGESGKELDYWSYDKEGNDRLGKFDAIFDSVTVYAQLRDIQTGELKVDAEISETDTLLRFDISVDNIPSSLADPVLQIILRHNDNVENLYYHLSVSSGSSSAIFEVSHRNLDGVGVYLLDGVPTGIHDWKAEYTYAPEKVTVTVKDGDRILNTYQIFKQTKFTKLDQLTKADYEFDGYYADGDLTSEFDSNMKIMSDTTIFTKWLKINSVTCVEGQNGTVTTDKGVAKVGEIVKITVSPNIGYLVKTVTVVGTDDSTKAVDVTTVDGTTYTFVMPDYK
ncbi:MAG: hypothetical protein A3204_01965 [Candidatus Methanarcanum hacksteinii]|nr:MAG: hypothetical protein A3204_01965 [Candidatus Methanarcanum hacksteinii]